VTFTIENKNRKDIWWPKRR